MNKIQFIEKNIYEINEKYKGCYVNKILELTSKDVAFVFSKNKCEALFISLFTQNPFIKVYKNNYKETLNDLFLNNLKTKLLSSCFIEANLFNNDSIVDLHFVKTTDTYEKKNYHLLFECFKGNSNLILLENNIVILAYRYHSLDTNHPIVLNTNYVPIKNNFTSKEIIESQENEKIFDYLDNINSLHLKEKYSSLLSKLKRKKKSLENKINALENEKNEANEKLQYKNYADYYLVIMDEIKKGDKFFEYEGRKIPLKENYSKTDNLTYLYKIYKKAKATISKADGFINEAKNELDYVSNILLTKDFYTDQDYLELIQELNNKNILRIKIKTKTKEIKAIKPYFFIYKNIKIGFGKNNLQNNELTFNLARKGDYFLHIKNDHGSHVVIFLDNKSELSDEVLETAIEATLFLSKKESIEVMLASIKDVKKSPTLGLVNVLKYETYNINIVSEEVKNLVLTAKRF